MKKQIFIIISIASCLAVSSQTSSAQDMDYYKSVVETLAHPTMEGRGYVGNGVLKAQKYLCEQFRSAGVDELLLQPFTIDINTFPGNTYLSVDKKILCPGEDFLMREYSVGAHGHYKLVYIDTQNYNAEETLAKLSDPKYKEYFGFMEFSDRAKAKEFSESGKWNELPLAGMIYRWSDPIKFYKAYADHVSPKPIVWVSKDFPTNAKSISISVDNKFMESYESSNIIAKVNGERSDSTFVVVGHYDHLGHFGKDQIYPGVNDNASGAAALVSLAKYYKENKPKFDVVFIAFAGEEAGLKGSTYYVNHPVYPLDKIKYLVNFDMIGDNAPFQYCEISVEGQKGLDKMNEINSVRNFFTEFQKGELASNSDHYPFAEKHVPCIGFIQEEGDCFKYYHTYKDDLVNAIYSTYPKMFSLVVELFDTL